MSVRLPAGHYFGTARRQIRVGDLVVSELVYSGNASLASHSHENAFLTVVLEGGQEEIARGRRWQHRPGTLALQPANSVHCHHIGDQGLLCLNVEIGAQWARANAHAFQASIEPAHLHIRDAPFTGAFVAFLRPELRSGDDLSPLAIEGGVMTLLAQAMRCRDRLGKASPHWLKQVHDMVHDCFAQPLSLKSLAAVARVHPVHLARTFQKQYGYSVAEYIRRLRIQHASESLRRTRKPLSAIALECGFADQAHLTRSFKRMIGVTPAEYRRLC